MIPEFSYCECDDLLYTEGLYKTDRGVIHTEKSYVLEKLTEFWINEWNTYPWTFSNPTKLLIPGGLI